MKKTLLTLVVVLYLLPLFSQDMELSKTVPLSKKAQINKLSHLEYDNNQKTFTLSYLTKVKKTFLAVETYLVDYNFNLLKSSADEYDINQAKEKLPWWNYKGDELTGFGISVDEKNNLILRRTDVFATYNWNSLRYKFTSKTKEKVKLRNDDGDKYYNHKYVINDDNLYAFILCGIKDSKDKDRQNKDLYILKINQDLDVEKKLPIKFDDSQRILASKSFWDKDGNLENWVFLLQSIDNESKITVLNISKDLELLDKIGTDIPKENWKVEDIVWHAKTNSLYFYGPSGKGSFQLLRVTNSKVDYITQTPFSEFKQKVKRPSSQTKGDPYSGKTYFIGGASVLDDGSLIIFGQNWDLGGASNVMSMMGGSGDVRTRYMDCFAFHFNNNGTLLGQYIYYTKDKGWSNEYPNDQSIIRGKAGNYFYWLIMPQSQFGFSHHPTMIAKINSSTAEIDEFKVINDFPKQKGIFFHEYDYPWFETGDGTIVFFGSVLQSPGSFKSTEVWFSRFRID